MNVELASLNSEQTAEHMDELTDLYMEVYAEPPYEWGQEHAELFVKRLDDQRQQRGFTLIAARDTGQLVGIGFGVTLSPSAPWWQNLNAPIDDAVTREHPDRTFALIELLVRAPWRRRHIAEQIHHRLLMGRIEERATLTSLPAAEAAQAAYRKWGWESVAQKRNPLPGSPIFDVMVKPLSVTS